jgi:hypothetical protein
MHAGNRVSRVSHAPGTRATTGPSQCPSKVRRPAGGSKQVPANARRINNRQVLVRISAIVDAGFSVIADGVSR